MSALAAIARKELRTYFLAPVALIFIATFLLASLFAFFWVEGFFSRNVADIRPLFAWLPILLIFLVPAVGMRLWSEEERMGTMELLRTFPLRTRDLVLGKFLAGLSLVAVALVLTLPIPMTVDWLGDLDWGPVLGGYLATLLLAGAYLAITLCVSALTASQIVALVFSSVLCGTLYLLGSDPVASLFGNRGAEILRALGAGSRFESILRGVIDLRDLLYYVSIIGFGLVLNAALLDARRWSQSRNRASFRLHTRLGVLLVGLNLLALNGIAAPLRGVRIDLTAQGEYSVSSVTRRLLDGLDEPLLIRGYFSSKTHPLLTPLVPRIRDLIEEYGALGGERVRAEFLDPTSDPEIEKEANQDYGIKSIPFQFASRHEASVVNSYFDVLIRYGDQYETLSFQDLIEVEVHGMDLAVRLRNLEYDLTRSIQKVVYGFQSLESVLARLPQEAHFTAFITRESLPPGFEGLPEQIESAAKAIEERSGGRFHWEIVDPDAEGSAFDRQALYERYGFKPMALSIFSQQTFLMHLLLEVGEYRERIIPSDSHSEADIRKELVAALKRAGTGSLKTVGWAAAGGFGGLSFDTLRETLNQTYHVEDVDLASGRVPGQVDVLLVLDPRDQGEEARYAIDQFLMRGGSAIIATGSRSLEGGGRQGLNVSKHESGLDTLLASYGVRVGSEVVLDQQNVAFPIPVERNLGGFTVREIQMLRYPAFVDVRPEQMDRDNPALAGLPGVVMHWSSVVEAITPGPLEEDPEQDTEEDAEARGVAEEAVEEFAADSAPEPDEATTVLLRSSEAAWLLEDFDAQPNFTFFPQLGWKSGTEMQSHSLAVSRVGPLASHYRDREAPQFDVEGGAREDEPSAGDEDGDDEPVQRRGDVIETSPERTRLVVLGSATFVSDFAVDLSQQQGSDSHLANLQLIQNLVDWCLEDIDLLKIRSRGRYARLLAPISAGLRQAVEWGHYGFALVAVVAIGGATLRRRRQAQPMVLPARPAVGEGGGGTGPLSTERGS